MVDKKKVLFICLGNICRSPIAEAVFGHLVKEKGLDQKWEVDSAAIGDWHVGNRPDKRALKALGSYNLSTNHRARQIKTEDFNNFDYIFGMDEENIEDLETLAPQSPKAKLLLLGEFDPEGDRIIRDPYYDRDDKGFEKCYQQCIRCCSAFIDKSL
ncbi:low molecular weight phosphotyrosine protein phosphatase 1-like [Artemia franciscana]|uniref:Low molecular weight phosphotyrosine protein phosphatase n=1 Tax=Artemia franciscana TaxID=6661 RepID=A0AA88L1W1_ARTSF|nr:hypothetical protein QYM36_009404 [Artemia franciscana]